MDAVCMVMTAVGSEAAAEVLAQQLVEARLAACVQVMPLKSFYVWQGESRKEAEYLLLVKTRARAGNAGLLQNVQGLDQTGAAPVEDMVVGQGAAVVVGCGEAADIFRVHPVVDPFVRPEIAAGRHTGFQVDDPQVGRDARPLRQRIAPHVGEFRRPRDRAVL